MTIDPASSLSLRTAIRLVALLNLLWFFVEVAVAVAIGSVSLLADSIDFLEDASVNFLILRALAWSAPRRAKFGMLLAFVLLLPTLATFWMLVRKFLHAAAPQPVPLLVTGVGALAINFFCALRLARFRLHAGSLTRAAFLSARNDVLANIAIVVAGALTARFPSTWPDLIVGAGIALINLDGARKVLRAARAEHRAASA